MKKLPQILTATVLLALASQARAGIVVESQQLDIQNMHDASSIGITLSDESTPNTSSILLVATSFRFSDTLSTDVTLTRGGNTFTADLFDSSYFGGNGVGNAIYAFNLGDASAGEGVTLNNISTDAARETFTALQISGATLTGAQFASAGINANSISTTFASDLDSGSFTIWAAGNVSKRSLSSVIPSDVNNVSNWNAGAAGNNHAAGWAYNGTLSGPTTVGFNMNSDGNTSLIALNLQVVPEPSTYALLFGGLSLGIILIRRRMGN
jgi:hypothetical protein